METTKIDRSRLKTIKSYAKLKGYTVQRIYQFINEGSLKVTEIDGVKFIIV